MKLHRRGTAVYLGVLMVIVLWVLLGLLFAIRTWFETLPLGSIKMDALEEIAATASILNVALPIGLVTALTGFYLAMKKRIPIALPIIAAVLFMGLSIGALRWWNYMDDAHGPNISLSRNHLWWAR